ncbi:MAG: hypothetical protein ORN28_06800 [Rhodoferax sp.]|nr:hypothetical protein [Rhodoferax sp.]
MTWLAVRAIFAGLFALALTGTGFYIKSLRTENLELRVTQQTAAAAANQQEQENEKRVKSAETAARTALESLDAERSARADADRRLRTVAASSPARTVAASAPTGPTVATTGDGQCIQDLDRLGRVAARTAVALSESLDSAAERDTYIRQLIEAWPQ